MFARGGAAAEVSDRAWLHAMLEVEAALASACASHGLIPAAAAAVIARACVPEHFDITALGRGAAAGGNPVIPLVDALRAAVGDGVAPSVHHGATSQDILDTAAMLVARRALAPILADAEAAVGACVRLSRAHRDTPMLARTLLQPALATTFGLTAASWMTALAEARLLVTDAASGLAVQLGGPAGTLGGFAGHGAGVTAELAAELGLAVPTVPWATDRVRPARLASALGVLAGALGKVARDLTLLAQGEVGEVRPGEDGGSSSMAHKRNPIAAVAVLACSQRVPGLVATLHAAMVQEHQRAAGAWHAEWEPWSDVLRLTGAGAAWAREGLERADVNTDRMRDNLEAAVAAHGLDRDPGAAAELVDRALAAHADGDLR